VKCVLKHKLTFINITVLYFKLPKLYEKVKNSIIGLDHLINLITLILKLIRHFAEKSGNKGHT